MKIRTLQVSVKNFVDDWVRASSLPRPACFAGRCEHLARKLCRELRLNGIDARLKKGHFLAWRTCRAPSGPHCWLTVDGKYIVDPSVEQFIRTRKYIRPIGDRRYR